MMHVKSNKRIGNRDSQDDPEDVLFHKRKPTMMVLFDLESVA